MSNSDLGAKAPSVKDDFKKQQPTAGSRKEANEILERLNKSYKPSRNLTIGGGLEKISHQKSRMEDERRYREIESGLGRVGERVQLTSRFNAKSSSTTKVKTNSRSRSRTRTRS